MEYVQSRTSRMVQKLESILRKKKLKTQRPVSQDGRDLFILYFPLLIKLSVNAHGKIKFVVYNIKVYTRAITFL